MGFESSQVARRRLAALASSNGRVQEALSPSAFPGFFVETYSQSEECPSPYVENDRTPASVADAAHGALATELDDLAKAIVSTPGAGGALLAAFAAQARALNLVIEAAKRAGASPLPASVLLAAQQALSAPSPLTGVMLT